MHFRFCCAACAANRTAHCARAVIVIVCLFLVMRMRQITCMPACGLAGPLLSLILGPCIWSRVDYRGSGQQGS